MRHIFTLVILSSFFIARSQDGTPDPSFGTNGLISTNVGTVDANRQKITVFTPSGKILQCYSVSNGTNNDFGLARYNSDGSLDNTFGTGGTVKTDFGGDDGATALTVQTDGKIIVVGYRIVAGNSMFAVARYLANGTLDVTFDGDGKVTTVIGSDDLAYAVAQNNGVIVVGGTSFINATSNYVFALARYNSNGSLDNTFDGDGKVTTNFNGFIDVAYAMAVQANGQLVVGGSSFNGSNNNFALARYNPNGSLDNSFDGDGKLTTLIGADAVANSIALQADQKLVVAGSSNNGSNNDFAVVRYTTTGALDNTFDGDGKATTPVGAGADIAYGVLIQSDDRIVLSGSASNGTDLDFGVARFFSNGMIDNSFGGNNTGRNLIDFGGEDIGYAIAPQGINLMVGGVAGTSLALTRLLNSSTVLPVRFSFFVASRQNNSVLLNWQTTSEQSVVLYEILRSNDGSTFTKIGQVQAVPGSTGNHNYLFSDVQPLQPIGFYRLKIIDDNRSSSLSEILAIRFNTAVTLQVFPNPVKNLLYVQFTAPAGKMQVRVLDVLGRAVITTPVSSSGNAMSVPVNVGQLKAGIYFMEVNGQVVRFVKE